MDSSDKDEYNQPYVTDLAHKIERLRKEIKQLKSNQVELAKRINRTNLRIGTWK